MKTIDNEQIERTLEDIASIKEVINRNKPILSSLLKKQNLTLSWFYKEFVPHRYDHISLSSGFLFYFLIVYFIIKDIPYFIIPFLSIIYGLIILFPIGLSIKHSLITGYYFLVTGICLLIFNTIPAPIAVSISIGAGSLIGAVLGYINQKSGKEE